MGSAHVTMAPGDIVAGRYRLDALIGQGGFGAVYRATQLPIGRTVALKMLLHGALAHAEGRARFRREAELAQRLSHPNTVRLYDFGETDDGLPFIAWELLEGRPLDAVLAAEGRLSVPRVARIAAQTLKALMEAHAVGIVHRDIKPSNVFLCDFSGERDFVKVLDFGIAKSTLAQGKGLTPEGYTLGTPAYMAPEQVQGLTASPRGDLYALGLVMAEMITGKPVYAGSVALEVIMAQLADRPPPLSPEVLSSPLGPTIARATQKRQESRFASAAEMLEHLEAAVDPSLRAGASAVSAEPATEAGGAAIVPPFAAIAVADTEMVLAPTGFAPVPPAGPDGGHPQTPALSEASAATEAAVATQAPVAAAPPRARTPPTLLGEPPPAPGPPPPLDRLGPLPLPAAPAKAAFPKGRIAIAALAGALVIGASVAAVLLRHTSERTTPGVGRVVPVGPAAAPVTGRHFATLAPREIRERIERAGYRVVRLEDKDAATRTWHITGTTSSYVSLIHLGDAKAAESMEQSFLSGGAVATRDGVAILHVFLSPRADALKLLDQITR